MQISSIKAPMTHTQLIQFHDAVAPRFAKIWESIEENERFANVEHFTEEQEKQIREQHRLPYSMGIIRSKLIPISAFQRASKTDFQVDYASDPNDELKAIIANICMKDATRRCKFSNIEEDVFDSGIFIKYGVSENYIDESGYYPQPSVRLLDYKNVVWDLNSVSLDQEEDCLFKAKIEKKYRYEIRDIYGKEVADKVAEQTSGTFEGRMKTSYYVSTDKENTDYDIVSIFTHYHKCLKKYYCVAIVDKENLLELADPIVNKFRNKKEAEAELRKINLYQRMKGIEEEGEILEKSEVRYDKYVFTYQDLLEYEETDWEMNPITMFFPIFLMGKFISLMDFLKSPQQFIDRLWSQIDFILGRSIKKVIVANPAYLAENETKESATKKLNQVGGIIWSKNVDGMMKELQDSGFNGQLLQITEIMKSYLEDLPGGKSFQGLGEGASESGVAFQKKQQQGTMVASIFLNNFKRWKHQVGERLLWSIKKYSQSEQIIKINGGELKPEMLELLQQHNIFTPSYTNNYSGSVRIPPGDLDFMRNSELELMIVEDEFTDNNREKSYQKNLAAAQVMPEIVQTKIWKINTLKGLGYDYSDIQEILKEFDQMAQAAQEQKQQENDIKKANVLTKLHSGISKHKADMTKALIK